MQRRQTPINNASIENSQNKTLFEFIDKRRYISYFLPYKGFKGTVVNRALPSLHEVHLKTR